MHFLTQGHAPMSLQTPTVRHHMTISIDRSRTGTPTLLTMITVLVSFDTHMASSLEDNRYNSPSKGLRVKLVPPQSRNQATVPYRYSTLLRHPLSPAGGETLNTSSTPRVLIGRAFLAGGYIPGPKYRHSLRVPSALHAKSLAVDAITLSSEEHLHGLLRGGFPLAAVLMILNACPQPALSWTTMIPSSTSKAHCGDLSLQARVWKALSTKLSSL